MRIVLFSQDPNKLLRELVTEIGRRVGPCTFVAGGLDSNGDINIPNVAYIAAPPYKRDSIRSRAFSWVKYTLHALFRALILINRADLFLFATSPPFIGVLGYLGYTLAQKKYILIVYDIYPDIAENFGLISRKGLLSKFWRLLNRKVYCYAKNVITISEEMARNISDQLGPGHSPKKIIVIPTWVDTSIIKPLSKCENSFAIDYGQKNKITVLYAGNFGNVSGVSIIPKIASSLKSDTRLHFFLVGRGEKFEFIRNIIQEMRLTNITMLPYQSEEILPLILAMADISLVMLDRYASGKSIPSKIYYYMAAGSSILAHCAKDDALERMINKYHCGLCVQNEKDAIDAIRRLADDDAFLQQCKGNSRKVAEMFFDKERCISQFIEVLIK